MGEYERWYEECDLILAREAPGLLHDDWPEGHFDALHLAGLDPYAAVMVALVDPPSLADVIAAHSDGTTDAT